MCSSKRQLFYVLLLACIWVIGLQTPSQAANSSVELLGFKITFEGVDYNAATNESTWTYRVQGTYSGPHDLSHWILELCNPAGTHIVPRQGGSYKTSHDAEISNRADPHHGITGIKFDVEVDKSDGGTIFWFVLQGNWEVGEVDIAVKAGQPKASDKILGPSCIPELCEVHYNVLRNRSDVRVLQPGTFASILSVIQLSGTGGVKLEFDEFGDAQYLADSSAPPVQLEYSIGNDLAEADLHGWLPASQFNGTELSIGRADVQAGTEIIIWVRSTVESYNSSSDYHGSGTVRIIPNCI